MYPVVFSDGRPHQMEPFFRERERCQLRYSKLFPMCAVRPGIRVGDEQHAGGISRPVSLPESHGYAQIAVIIAIITAFSRTVNRKEDAGPARPGA